MMLHLDIYCFTHGLLPTRDHLVIHLAIHLVTNFKNDNDNDHDARKKMKFPCLSRSSQPKTPPPSRDAVALPVGSHKPQLQPMAPLREHASLKEAFWPFGPPQAFA